MMNANSDQLAGLSYIQKLRTETRQEQASQDQFAIYDALTPDTPVWAWPVAKYLLISLIHILTERQNPSKSGSFAHRESLTEAAQ